MFPLCVLLMLLCLHCGNICSAIHVMQMVNIQVEFGEPAILPCNGSAYLDEKLDLNVQWEAMGQDVAILSEGGLSVGDQFEGRVLLHSEEKLWEGDWSVVLEHTILSDTDMYECILQGRKTISTVWLEVVVMTESQPMEAFEETVTSFPDEDPPETSTESSQWDNLPWVRIVLIAGVLLVTAVVLCILGARGKI
ncbi:hypothetical protein D5F01_LYC23642 [Larimichthys crocea]|uniref:Ig-like domain-containing protein n=1 Tax=Larimichthys crocea TaxID=215358 RepID=A0A6G0HI11_LARCR|nr:hypothetical protein D5F01_LYC23642 [Larimichthys crocea]